MLIKLMRPCFLVHALASDQINEQLVVPLHAHQDLVLGDVVLLNLLFFIHEFLEELDPGYRQFYDCGWLNCFAVLTAAGEVFGKYLIIDYKAF